mmetsp:Transcript_36786/g.58929  ORF Transcript_36786/g.58929 Transcript_36786/m.58929 type:complete len:340 (+) Transcript_36786:58-1077(+)|eukprot:CAMPEP_0169225708 /NCGR_PEP_ID=MMETSP1016-20121227/23346_1 /TAXON_ID=342587 /ORGANISM="Karlodinium micrum, Strain CCMP2283" /LENGTH=339 /DNA_ID=CAMNT_0009304241 /DNA_START=48 /DNA_END=1064 /DNA_ORIENTATION=+
MADCCMESSASGENHKRGEGGAAGTTRAVMISGFRQFNTIVIRTLSRYAASPHRMFRPENLTIQRVEQALHAQAGGNDQLLRGFMAQYRCYGLRQTITLRSRSIVLNSVMGTLLFGTYDALRDPSNHTNLRDSAAALAAGSFHGAVCAPLEVASRRLMREASVGASTGQLTFTGLRSTLLDSPRGQLLSLSMSVLPLSAARDGFGILCFFSTFEWLRGFLQNRIPQDWVTGDVQACQNVKMVEQVPEKRRVSALLRTVATLTAGGSAGVAYKLAAFPFDVLLVYRLKECERNVSPPALIHYTRQLLQEIGLRRFLPQPKALASAFPSSAIGLLVYDWLR